MSPRSKPELWRRKTSPPQRNHPLSTNRVELQWAAYFRFGNSAHVFDQIGSYARMRIGGFLAKKHRRTRKFGWAVVAFAAHDSLGLISLHGTVVAPRPFRDWRGRPNAGGERRR
ncbi:group II intron maturase-specific domain-containing protein [Actinacidiphila glaucinigra]|uniref:group II intron maturase-specific domain-containing protein n=1 Tax=Actinacidiphila glaucinigra TaxID=235986 RepID=UPI003D8F3AD3